LVATPGKPGPETDAPESLMEDIRGALASHSNALAAFEGWLTPDVVAQEEHDSRTTAVVKIHEVRQANRELEDILDDKYGRIFQVVRTYRDLLGREFAQLDNYRDQTRQFDQTLVDLAVDQPAHCLAERVFQTVHDLRQANDELNAQLEDCQHRLAEQTARAAAAESDARVDVLTQLPNRRAFEEKLAEQRSLYQRRAQPYVLVLFDADRFKLINDTYGHTTGDAVLAMLGRVFRNCRRATDHISRFGGEEFALLMPLCSKDRAEAIAERYRQRIEAASLRYKGQRLRVTVSAGVAPVDCDESNGTVMERADMALYAAKKAGGNRTSVHDDNHHATAIVSVPEQGST
jgi:diguanylate cyclase (GGDEF)-like protein